MKTIRSFLLWLRDLAVSGGLPPYDVVNDSRQVKSFYCLPEAIENSFPSSDHFHYLMISSLFGTRII